MKTKFKGQALMQNHNSKVVDSGRKFLMMFRYATRSKMRLCCF